MAGEAVRIPGPWLGYSALAIAGINVFDGIFTLEFLQHGLAEEANPVMRALYLASPWVFLGVKLAAVNICVALLLKLQSRWLARAALLGCAVAYVALASYELGALVHGAAGSIWAPNLPRR